MNKNNIQIMKLLTNAEVLKQCHNNSAKRYLFYKKVINCFILILSFILGVLIFSDLKVIDEVVNLNDGLFRIIIGLIALLIFVFALTENYLNLWQKGIEHDNSVKIYTNFIRYVGKYKYDKDIEEDEKDFITREFEFIKSNTPIIPDDIFIKSKQKYLQKEELSNFLEKEPFKSKKEIINILKNKDYQSEIIALEKKEIVKDEILPKEENQEKIN